MKKKALLIVGIIAAIGISACSDKENTNMEPVVGTVAGSTDESKEMVSDEETEQTTEQVTETTTEPEPEPVSVDIVMVGDILLHDRVNESGLMADGTYNYDHMFAQVKDEISAADIAIVNQEVILGGREIN